MSDRVIVTDRLILRWWRDADAAPWAAMCADPDVMRYLGPVMTAQEARAILTRMVGLKDSAPYAFWAMEHRDTGAFMGFCGLKPGAAGTPIAGQVEIGWRLARRWWGAGYAVEGARASLDWGWSHLDTAQIRAITTPDNSRSRSLMTRLGMIHRADLDFDHAGLAPADPLRPHVTYAIARPQ